MLRRVVICLALGIASTVLAAWFFSIVVKPWGRVFDYGFRRVSDTRCGLHCVRLWQFGATIISLSAAFGGESSPDAEDVLDEMMNELMDEAKDPERFVPVWARSELVPWGWNSMPPPDVIASRSIYVRGWPLPALWCSYEYSVEGDPGRVNIHRLRGLQLSRDWRGFGASDLVMPPVVLPLKPLWPAFIADTAFYALLWGTLLFAPGAIRRRWRRRRGRCPACGYDRRGLAADAVCPECGIR